MGTSRANNHPDIMKKAKEEIDFAVGKSRLVEESDKTNLPYLQSIVKETLRIHPPGPLIANANNWVDVRGQYFHLLPFGSGRRGCPGTSLALQLVQTTLAAIIQCFKWKVDGGNSSVDMEEGPGITLLRANPLICAPVTRLNPFPSF
ncbi:hypothetical protein JCGZ_06823 [Jatropha curcas]|uniref:Cytochrome P450 n=1 Tax=Jatropha curcas TaxID=180498 RepID=A0A067KZT7_JATCU|nr:hypothetical protein JCGZ_06823 [Jatropha curcas]